MPIDDVVLAADEYAGWAVEAIRGSQLTAGNLYKEVGTRVGRLAPFADDVVQS